MLTQARTKLATLLLIALTAIGMAGTHAWVETQRHEAQDAQRTARLAIDHLRALLIALLDVETGARGYALVREEAYLEPYASALGRVDHELAVLRDHEALREERDRLAEVAAGHLAHSARLVALVRSGDAAGARAVVASDVGIALMDEARAIVDRLEHDHETRRLAAQEEHLYFERLAQLGTLGALSVLALLLLVVWAGVQRDLAESDAQQRVIQAQAQQLAIKSEGLERLTSTLEEHNDALARANRELETAARDRAHAMADLERRNRDLDQFAYITSHDLKAPLRAIANLTTWIEDDLPQSTTAETRENLALLKQRTARMETLIEGILAYSRAGRAKESAGPAVRTVEQLVAELRVLLGLSEHELRLEGAASEIPSRTVEITQVLSNLVSNAVKHGGTAEPIHVRVERMGSELCFAVKDRGPGIEPRYHDRIFEIFQTLQPRDRVEGAGIGLAIVRKLVQGAGGRVWVDSELGRGATFSFTWPPETA